MLSFSKIAAPKSSGKTKKLRLGLRNQDYYTKRYRGNRAFVRRSDDGKSYVAVLNNLRTGSTLRSGPVPITEAARGFKKRKRRAGVMAGAGAAGTLGGSALAALSKNKKLRLLGGLGAGISAGFGAGAGMSYLRNRDYQKGLEGVHRLGMRVAKGSKNDLKGLPMVRGKRLTLKK